ncbi:MAG: glycosyltransferase family 4 protein [Bacteroidia bacterium]
MKILQLCNKVPYPEKDGGAISVNVFSQELVRTGHSVKMLAMNTSKHYVEIKDIPDKFKTSTQLETVDIDNSISPVKALIALLKRESYNVSRFDSKEFGEKLRQILEKETYDVIQLEGLYLAPYISIIRKFSTAPIVMRAHNVEWKIWKRLAIEEKNPLKKVYLNILAKQLRKYEGWAVNACDGIITFTVNDLNLLKEEGCKTPIAHIPFGIDTSRYLPVKNCDPQSLFFIGALDWMPNLQGLEWFLKEVWNKVHAALPEVKLHVAGRNMPDEMKKSTYPGIIFYGEIEDALAFMNQYNIMMVPLLAGSGVRIKIIEGMALCKPIITTSIGIEGIECEHGKDVLVADSPDEVCKAIESCIHNPGFAKQVASDGRIFAETHHDIKKIVQALTGFYGERINSKNSA